MGGTGLEHPADSAGKTAIPQKGGSESGALSDDALAEVVALLRGLKSDVRQQIIDELAKVPPIGLQG